QAEGPTRPDVDYRTDPQPVARAEQLPLPRIPDGERPLAVEVPHAVLAGFGVHVQDDLGVRGRGEYVAFARERLAQLDVVENLPVEGDPQAAVGVLHGLVAGGEVDDAPARIGEANWRGGVHPAAVRAAMPRQLDHATQ